MSAVPRPKSPPRRCTLEQFLTLPSDGPRCELIHGELVVSPQPSDEHQDLLHDLGELLKRWVRHHELGKVSYDIDMVLDEAKDLAYAPDLLFVTREHAQRRRQGRLYGPADLCVEILSPHDKPRVQRAKHRDYAAFGVPWYWIINALGDQPLLEENELVAGAYQVRCEVVGDAWFASGLFPGLHFRMRQLIAGDLSKAVKGKARKLV